MSVIFPRYKDSNGRVVIIIGVSTGEGAQLGNDVVVYRDEYGQHFHMSRLEFDKSMKPMK